MKKVIKPKKHSSDAEALRKWLNSIPVGDYSGVVETVLKECMINKYRFANWRSGMAKISPLEKIIINRIAGSDIF